MTESKKKHTNKEKMYLNWKTKSDNNFFHDDQDHALVGVAQKVRRFESREACMASCLATTTFTCR
jgi:hypothetical protein